MTSNGSLHYILALQLLCLVGVSEAAEFDRGAVRAAWLARQRSARSAQFEWQEEITQPRGAHMDPSTPDNVARLYLPPEDMTYTRPMLLKLCEDKLRYEHEGQDYSVKAKKYVRQGYISICDGTRWKIVHPPGIVDWPTSIISTEKTHSEFNNYHLYPLVVTYRAMDPAVDLVVLDDYSLVPAGGVINGVRCIVLEEKPKPSVAAVKAMWLDPQKDYSVVRHTVSANGKLLVRIDIEYKRDEEHGWVPATWQMVWHKPSGKLYMSTKAHVTSYTIGKEDECDRDAFAIDSPPGTIEVEENNKTAKKYFVQQDGNRRELLPHEMSLPYEHIARRDSSMGYLAYLWSNAGWALVIPVTFLGVVAIVVAYRRYKGAYERRL